MSDPLDIARPAPAEEPFIITAMLSLVGASVWLVRRPDLLTQYYYSPEHLALTHLVTLGFITPFIMGVSLRLVPMTLGVGVVSRKLAWLQFALYGIGASGMVTHFLWSQWLAVGWSGLLVLAATIVQLINFTPVWRRARAGDWIARYFVAAQTHLVLVATVGVILGMQNAGYRWTTGLFPGTMPERLSAHFHLAAVGWVSSMIFGFQLKLVPTTAGSPRLLWVRFTLLQLGVLGLAATQLHGARGASVFALMIATAIVWQALGPIRSIRRRRRWLWEAVSLLLLVAVVATGLLLISGQLQDAHELRIRIQLAYAFTTLFGWVVLTASAVALKLFPLWVWKERFEPEWGTKPVPAVSELASPVLREVSGLCLTLGVAGTVVGIVLAHQNMIAIALKVQFVGVALFVINFARMARWALLKLDYRPPRSR